MIPAVEPVETRSGEPDLIDRIAQALPEDVRAEYYRELLHCRSLPESDEMLRLLRAMQFLALLIDGAPARVAQERERLGVAMAAAIDNIGRINAASEAWHTSLEQRLKQLPTDVANGISPMAVAAKINDSLRHQFIRSTIPQTADALGAVSERMKTACSEFTATADSLGNSYRGSAEEARKAVDSLRSEISAAADNAARFTAELRDAFSEARRWSLVMFGSGVLVIGLAGGMIFEHWLLRT